MAAKRAAKSEETTEQVTRKGSKLEQQVAQVRQSGRTNMYDRAGVQAVARAMGLDLLADRCEQLRYSAHQYLDLIQGAADVEVEGEEQTADELPDDKHSYMSPEDD